MFLFGREENTQKWMTATGISLRTMHKVWITVVLSTVLAACTSIECPVQNTVYMVCDLMKADGKSDTLGVDTLWVWTQRADGTDTLLVNRLCGTSATTLNLPISYSQPEDAFIVYVKDTADNYWLDTLRIKKESRPHFESVDCQAAFFHTITATSATSDIIDSVVIKNPEVNYDTSSAHFYLYLKARR